MFGIGLKDGRRQFSTADFESEDVGEIGGIGDTDESSAGDTVETALGADTMDYAKNHGDWPDGTKTAQRPVLAEGLGWILAEAETEVDRASQAGEGS